MRTRVKICGITEIDVALAAVEAGADALGFVFYAPSPRHVDLAVAREICHALPAFVTTVGLFVEPGYEEAATVSRQVGIDMLQFHGNETPEFCDSFSIPYIKAVRMHADADITAEERRHPNAKALLVDTFDTSAPGGSGHYFSWDRVPKQRTKPVILAGGLTTDNVGLAIAAVRPYAVDVSSGVESIRGQKDIHKIKRFIEAVVRADDVRNAPAGGVSGFNTIAGSP